MTQQQRKKVLYLITKSNWGGAQRYVYDLATHAGKRGYEPIVVFGGTGLLAEKLKQNEISVISIPSLQRDISFLKEFFVFCTLVSLFRKENPGIIHLNSSKAGGIGALAARLAGIKTIIFTVHGWPFLEDRHRIARMAIWLLSWFTTLLAHRIIVVSDFDLHTGKRMPFIQNKIIRIYNGIDTTLSFGSGKIIRNAFPHGARITGTIGELTKNKNQRSLIEKAGRDPDIYVAVVGEGEDRTMLERLIEQSDLGERVKLFGFIPAHDALKGFDVFALPSLKEGLPYVLLEAKLAGLPIDANRVGGVGEILDAKDMSEFTLERMCDKTFELYERP
jgi:glycosyltransferase involved in cell wall biosynthesis